ncbi:uncharacterized protein LOC142990491 [Genypterus blacodes]|uniref:uncharacterized protein LOC142990491 n=1 Tax=Genypterus blacodes TaxID=154954 RepID=UPI003F75C34B
MELWVLLVVGLLLCAQLGHSRREEALPCRPITATFCHGAGYSSSPHPAGVQGYDLQQIARIVETACSPDVAKLMCRVVVPECEVQQDSRIKPCRALCERVKSDCERLLTQRNLLWPAQLQCDALPEIGCVHGQDLYAITAAPTACQPVIVRLCEDLPYTSTLMPNILGHNSQAEAGLQIQQYSPLVKVQCSQYLKPFLCSVYIPECEAGRRLLPCRTLCELAKLGCEGLMNKFGFMWPEALKCDAFTTESCPKYGLNSTGRRCEPLTMPLCEGLSYNQTLMPNLLGHQTQKQAAIKMSFFDSLVKTVCSVDIRLFICSVYAPRCEAGEVQMPCRSLCERARQGCESLMTGFGVSWPVELRCDAFPEENCLSEARHPERVYVEDVVAKLNLRGYTVRGKSLSLETARLLSLLFDRDGSGDLDVEEFYKLELYVAFARAEYVQHEQEKTEFITEARMRNILNNADFALDEETFKALWFKYRLTGVNYDDFVAIVAKLQILKARFEAHLMSLPCDCKVANFSYQQFLSSVII